MKEFFSFLPYLKPFQIEKTTKKIVFVDDIIN